MGEMADYYAERAQEYEAHLEAQLEFCATKWMTAEGKVIHYRRMSDIHLFNAYQMLKRKLLTGQISNNILLRIQMNAMDAELQFREAVSGKPPQESMRGWNSRTGRIEEYDRPENALQILDDSIIIEGGLK